jgi:hypothetical protein
MTTPRRSRRDVELRLPPSGPVIDDAIFLNLVRPDVAGSATRRARRDADARCTSPAGHRRLSTTSANWCSRPSADIRERGTSDRNRLTAAGQVLRPNDSRCRNLPFVVLRGDRPLHLQQRPLNSDGPDEGSNDSSPPSRSALRDPDPPFGFLQSCPMLGAGFSCFASTKRPFVTSHSRPSGVIAFVSPKRTPSPEMTRRS